MFRMQRNGRLGARYNANSVSITKEHGTISFLLLVPFGDSEKTTSAAYDITHLMRIRVCSPYYLPSTYPIYVVIRRSLLSRFSSRQDSILSSLYCQSRYLIQALRLIWWYRWFILNAMDSAAYDLISHAPKPFRVDARYSFKTLHLTWFFWCFNMHLMYYRSLSISMS